MARYVKKKVNVEAFQVKKLLSLNYDKYPYFIKDKINRGGLKIGIDLKYENKNLITKIDIETPEWIVNVKNYNDFILNGVKKGELYTVKKNVFKTIYDKSKVLPFTYESKAVEVEAVHIDDYLKDKNKYEWIKKFEDSGDLNIYVNNHGVILNFQRESFLRDSEKKWPLDSHYWIVKRANGQIFSCNSWVFKKLYEAKKEF